MAANGLEMFLKNCPREITATLIEQAFEPGEIIIEQGSEVNQVYVLTAGHAKAYHVTQNGIPFVEYIYSPWELFGEVEAFNGKPAICSLEAINKCETVSVSVQGFLEWLKLDFSFARYILGQLSDKIYAMGELAPLNIIYPLECRLLIILWNKMKAERQRQINLSKEILAESLGTSVRSVNRIIKGLISKGILQYHQGVFDLHSPEKLGTEIKSMGYTPF